MSLTWRIARRADGARVEVEGQFDENAELAPLAASLSGKVELHLGGVTRINSTGVREWVKFVHDLPRVTELAYSHCSGAVVTQLNTIYNFRGRARVWSLYAPFVCEACGVEEQKLIDVRGLAPGAAPALPAFPCAKCGAPMAFDELPERYFSFLKET